MSDKRNGRLAVVQTSGRTLAGFGEARATVALARNRVEDLGRRLFDQPGNRDEVAGLLRGALGGLATAEGLLAEADGVNQRVDIGRRAVVSGLPTA